MTDELKKLFEQKQQAYRNYQGIQQINVFGKKSEELIAIDIAVETARQEWLSATIKYNAALDKYVKEGKQ